MSDAWPHGLKRGDLVVLDWPGDPVVTVLAYEVDQVASFGVTWNPRAQGMIWTPAHSIRRPATPEERAQYWLDPPTPRHDRQVTFSGADQSLVQVAAWVNAGIRGAE